MVSTYLRLLLYRHRLIICNCLLMQLLAAYNLLYSLARSPIAASKIPVDSLCEIGINYAI